MTVAEEPQHDSRTEMLRREGLITAARAAELTGWTLQTIHRHLAARKLDGARVGARWYVKAVSLAEMHRGVPALYRKILAEVQQDAPDSGGTA